MNAQLGFYLLWFALILSIYAAAVAVAGVVAKDGRFYASAVRAVHATFFVLAGATGILAYAFVSNDFTIKYVADHSSRVLPRFYAATGVWAGMEGSLTFWSFILAGLTAYAVHRNRRRAAGLVPWVIVTLSVIQAFFLVLQLFVDMPFETVHGFVPADGRGMNPQLQNPGMAFHPPALYVGYVGCAVPFAFAMAALITGRLDDLWLRLTRRFTLLAWLFLSIGIMLGAWWAYVELGWGGYWAWDPVENASLLPWLTATAFLHSAMLQERRGMFKVWNMVLVFLTFFLSILGTFLTRSGFVQSVHSFAASSIGWYFVGFMAFALVAFLVMFVKRWSLLRATGGIESVLSKEASFVYNNWLLIGILVVMLVGTFGEPVSKFLTGVATTFRGPYYNTLNVPLGILVLVLSGICPAIAWRHASAANLKRSFVVPVAVSVLFTAALVVAGYALGFLDLVAYPAHRYAVVTFWSAAFVVVVVATEFYKGAKARRKYVGGSWWRAALGLFRFNGRRYGGYLVHLGVVAMFVGFAGNACNAEYQKALKPGETMEAGPYHLTYTGQRDISRPTYQGVELTLEVSRGDRPLGTYGLQRRFYYREEQTTTEVAVHTTLLEDLYLILVSLDTDGTAVIKARINPLVAWVWLGATLLVLGTLLAMGPTPAERRETKP